jgi:hypothetical protein
LPTDSLHNFFKFECHGLVSVRANILIKLLVKLLDHPWAPTLHLVVHEENLPWDDFCLIACFPHFCRFLVQCVKFGWKRAWFLGLSVLVTMRNLKFVQFLAPQLVVVPKHINFLFLIGDWHQKLRIGWLTGQEFLNNLLHVWVTSRRTDFLESVFVLEILLHFLLHFGFQVSRPELLSQEVLLHFKLIWVFLLICGLLRYFLLALHAANSPLKRRLLILNRLIQSAHLLLPLSVVFINHQHERFESVLCLQTLLGRFALLISFFFQNREFRLVTFLLATHFDFHCY